MTLDPIPTAGPNAAAARDVTDSLVRRERAALRRVATVVAHGSAPIDVSFPSNRGGLLYVAGWPRVILA